MKRKPKTIRRLGLVANSTKPAAAGLLKKIVQLSGRLGFDLACDDLTGQLLPPNLPHFPSTAELAKHADLLLVLGGDGTMLRIVREINGVQTPIFGLNAGRLGFLTAVPSNDLPEALQKIHDGDYFIEPRPLIQAGGRFAGKETEVHALNDVVISRGATSRMIELEVSVDHKVVTNYRCDGLIVSSPTGSTAYSLSAGGAIISPDAEVLALTPICPHTLSNRSVIVNLKSLIQVRVITEKVETIVTADGQVQYDLHFGDSISIQRSRRRVHLLHLSGSSFFETVRRKLHWSGSNV